MGEQHNFFIPEDDEPPPRKPSPWVSFFLRPVGDYEIRARIVAMGALAVAAVVAAYFGHPGLSLALRTWLLVFALLTLLRLYATFRR